MGTFVFVMMHDLHIPGKCLTPLLPSKAKLAEALGGRATGQLVRPSPHSWNVRGTNGVSFCSLFLLQ